MKRRRRNSESMKQSRRLDRRVVLSDVGGNNDNDSGRRLSGEKGRTRGSHPRRPKAKIRAKATAALTRMTMTRKRRKRVVGVP